MSASSVDTWTMTVGADASPPRTRLEGTPQQEAFWEELLHGSGHVLLSARAGTGKSTSCREGMWRLLEQDRGLRIRYCCFNKKIADEFQAKCPSGVEVGTMHSFGLSALRRSLGNPQIERNKSYVLLDSIPGGASLPRWMRRTIVQVVGIAKNHNLPLRQPELSRRLDDLVLHYDVSTWGRDEEVVDRACDVLALSAESTALIDFDDMLWLPNVLGVDFPEIDYLFVDEAQDLNWTQHALVPRMNAAGGRTIFVGDPHQAIYMWRGADANSLSTLRDQLGAKVLPLTITFRCPRKHVDLARVLVPDFECGDGAPDGEVANLEAGAEQAAEPGSLVLCRSNAPLIAACLKLITARKRANVRGRAIGDQLGSIYRRIDASTIEDFHRGVACWRSREIARLERREGTEDLIESAIDRSAALDAIAATCSSPAEIPSVIDQLFADDDATNRVTFSSVHRAKGSEARTVYYLRTAEKKRKTPPAPWEIEQSRNIEYVALSRSLHSLNLLSPR